MGQILDNITGKLEKAILVIHGNDTGKVEMSSKDVVELARAALLVQAIPGAIPNGQGLPISASQIGQPQVLQVQYNPASLELQGNADTIPYIQMQQNIDAGVPNQKERPPMVALTVELYFDAMNPQDAFMFDKLRLSVGAVVNAVKRAGKMETGGYTVQHQTNGLLATVLRPETRLVTFAWGDLAFTGVLFEMQADYTMFSPSGRPVRSKVRLNIAQQVDANVDAVYWDKALDKVFNEDGVRTAMDATQKNGNLLNLQSLKGLL